MRVVSRLWNWIRRRKDRSPKVDSYSERREFVYLDEVSVLSILASRTGRIATESTESRSASHSSEVKSSVGVGFGPSKATLGGKIQAAQGEASQVSHKAIIQSSFKDLYDIERPTLSLYSASPEHVPTVDSILDLEELLGSLERTGLLVDPSALHRGDLLEVRVDLEADPIFRMATIITTFVELMEDNEELLQSTIPGQLPEIRSVARLLESLLAGLVPIRGRLVDFDWIRTCNYELLVHRSLLSQMPADARPQAYPAYLVGVAERDLFWKDIRRVLFSQAPYTVFCRLAASGLLKSWSPVKMADVFSGITSDFDEMIRGLGDELMSGFKRGVRSATAGTEDDIIPTMLNHDAQLGERSLTTYAEWIALHHEQEIDPTAIEALIQEISLPENWLDSVDSYRPVFAEMRERVDDLLKTETPPSVAHDLRIQAINRAKLDVATEFKGSTVSRDRSAPGCERFLDSEIVAIYW